MGIFNSMIAACAHGGEYAKARHMFDSMAEHGCEPDAVTYANLIRAFKKGGQWCAASRSIFRRFILSFSPQILEWGGHCSKPHGQQGVRGWKRAGTALCVGGAIVLESAA